MTIKRVNAGEAELVISLFDKYRVFYKQLSDLELAKHFINERLNNNESVIFVAFDDDCMPVGFTQLYPKYSSARAVKNWILNDLFVDDTHRKQGIGRQLINAAISFGKQHEAKFIQLETANNNYTAQSLYKAIGFIQQDVDDSFLLFKIAI